MSLWQRWVIQKLVYSLFLEIEFADMKLISVKKRDHWEVIPKVVIENDENKIRELNQYLKEKWDYVMPPSTYSHGCISRCMRQLWLTMDNFCFEGVFLMLYFLQTPEKLRCCTSFLWQEWEQGGLNRSTVVSAI